MKRLSSVKNIKDRMKKRLIGNRNARVNSLLPNVLIGLLLAIFLVFLVQAAYTDTSDLTQNVNDCGVLNTTNAVYTLTADVVSNSTCFNIMANNITLDGAGHIINYSAVSTLGYAFNVTGFNSTTIKNAIIQEGTSVTNAKHAIYR